MKNILSKKISIAIAGVLSVLVLSLCMFNTIHNQQSSNENSDLPFAPMASDQITEAAIDNPTYSPEAETSNSSNVLPNDNNSISKSSQDEPVKNNPARISCTGAEGYVDHSPSFGFQNVSSTNEGEDACYSLTGDAKSGKTLTIGPIGSIDKGTPFNTQGKAPWLDENQYLIKTVKIVTGNNNTKLQPKSTAGWLGCDDDIKNTKVRLSDIEAIEGLDNLNMSECTNAQCMFNGSDMIKSINATDVFFSSFTKVDNAKGICNYTSLNNYFLNKIAQAICTTATDVSWAFANNKDNLTSFEIDDEGSKVLNASYMFYQDKRLKTITANKLISSDAENVERMFYDCNLLKTISLNDTTNWNSNSILCDEMFKYCSRLEGEEGTAYADDEIMDKSYAKIDGGKNNPGYFTIRPGTKLQSLYVDGHQYFPVAGESLSKDITFYDACYNVLPRRGEDGKKYLQSDLGGKDFCAMYYRGTGSFQALRSIQISWNDAFVYKGAGQAAEYITDFLKGMLVGGNEGPEYVYKLTYSRQTPAQFDAVNLTDIWKAYNPNGDGAGFGGCYGQFWSCVTKNEVFAWCWDSHDGESVNWDDVYRGDPRYVCCSRAFN